MLTVKNLVGRQQSPLLAMSEPAQPAEGSDLATDLATAQADFEAAQQAQSEMYAAAEESAAYVVTVTEGVRTGKSLEVDGEDIYGPVAYQRAKAAAEYDQLRVEAGVQRVHDATLAERRIRAQIFAAEVVAELPPRDAAVNTALSEAVAALESLRAARNEREGYVAEIRRRADNLYGGADDTVIRLGPINPMLLTIAGTRVANRNVGNEAVQLLGPILEDLATPMNSRRTPR